MSSLPPPPPPPPPPPSEPDKPADEHPSVPLASPGQVASGPPPPPPPSGQAPPPPSGQAPPPPSGQAPPPPWGQAPPPPAGHAPPPSDGYAPAPYYAPSTYGAASGQSAPSWGAPPPTPPKRRSKALLLSVLGVVVLAALAVGAHFAFFADGAPEPLEADLDESVEAYAQQLVIGSCIEELPKDGEVDTVTAVPCDEDHEAQVVSAKKFSEDDDYPGDDAVRSQSAEKCTVDAIEDEEVDVSLVELSVWTPTEASWEQGDRVGLCIAALPEDIDRSLLD